MPEQVNPTQGSSEEVRTAKYANCAEEVTALIKARVPIIWVVTHEESRFIEEFTEIIANPLKKQVWIWSSYQGLVRKGEENNTVRAGGEEKDTWNPQKALERITQLSYPEQSKGLCFVLRDFHTVLGEPVPRQIRDMYDHLIALKKTLIITSPVLAHGPGGAKLGLPPTLEKQITVINYTLPTKTQIETEIRSILSFMQSRKGTTHKTKLDYTDDQINDFARSLQGLTLLEVRNAIPTSFAHLGRLDIDKLINDKRQIIRKSEILEFIDTPLGLEDVGGLDNAKAYLTKYAKAQSDEAKKFGVEPLKGILLTGVPGTGKSLLAKSIGKLWKVPLLRLDVGKVMSGLVGSSEGKMREVISQAESMSPSILWIDEVEKSLSGTKSSNFSDGGTLARVFGTLLTAMQDGLEGCTIVATANDITMLPPEFIRRFNEVFFVDLPGPEERWEIFKIHLEKRGRALSKFNKDKQQILNASRDYTGAEIEKSIKDAIAAAFYDDKEDIISKHLLDALAETKPIAKVMKAKIEKIRDAARGQYRYASSYAEYESKNLGTKTSSGKKLDMNSVLDGFDEIKTKKEKSKEITEEATKGRFEEE